MSTGSSSSTGTSTSDPGTSSSVPATSSSVPATSSSDPGTSSSLPASSSSVPPTSSSTTALSSSSTIASSSTTALSSSTTAASSSTTQGSSVVVSPSVVLSTQSNGNVVTHTEFQTNTISGGAPTTTSSPVVHAATKGFFQNKGAVAATFTIVGLVAAGILFALVTSALRRRRARRFDREIAEEAKRVPPPVFVDDEDYTYGSGGAYGGGGYSDYANAAPQTHADPFVQQAGEPYAHGAGSDGYGPAHSDGHPASDAVHSGGTPSNYMYPSGYSDLGFSDVSSHGTYAQPPMDAYGNHGGYGGGGFGAGAAGAGAAAAMGMAGAYEMTGYGHAQQGQVGSDWHAQGGHPGNGTGYMYPGEDAAAQGYPPTAATSATAASASDLGRTKSAGGARSFGTPSEGSSSGKGIHPAGGAQPQYADGYVNQYQTHVVEDDAYGGMVHSQHGHTGELDDEPESDYGEDNDEPRVLKVANE
ncbi:hypothetical protein C8R45DRAFT_83545 [Mycena sanguinolenta]|nr:hypothetical protein C8R45DRAFT_83545 [Mycena sanguinolenta]